ncbi:MAG: polyprenyl synthetase family protein, partial [Acidobacteria bacterium]|nr:polyprenyl synthetase family protein [Acidobacteriota bacterium]
VQMAVNLGWNEIQPIIAETSKNLIEGELLQSHRGYDLNISEEEYIEIVRLKTAKLFATCTVVPPILNKESKQKTDALFNYGLFIGIAFQIVDDCLDFLSDEKTLGKPVGQDLKEGKVTLPLIYLRDFGKIQDKEFLEAIVAGRRFDNSTLEELSERVISGGFADMALSKAKEFAEKAREQLKIFEDSKAKNLLEKLPDFILNRSF